MNMIASVGVSMAAILIYFFQTVLRFKLPVLPLSIRGCGNDNLPVCNQMPRATDPLLLRTLFPVCTTEAIEDIHGFILLNIAKQKFLFFFPKKHFKFGLI